MNPLHIKLDLILVDGIDGAGKTTYIKQQMGKEVPESTYLFQQKFPTVYPKNWDTVKPEFFLKQMIDESLGLNQVIYWLRTVRHEIEGDIHIKVFVDRSFYSTAAYANDLYAFVEGLYILQSSLSRFRFVLPERDPTFDINVTAAWFNTNPHACVDRILRRKTRDETQDPMDNMDVLKLTEKLWNLRETFRQLQAITLMNLNHTPQFGERETKELIRPVEVVENETF